MSEAKLEKSSEQERKGEKRKAREGGRGSAAREKTPVISTAGAVVPRFIERYKSVAIPALSAQFGYKNPNELPRITKIVVNMGLGAAVANPKIIDSAVEELRAITGQKPVVTRSKKAIASFKLRAGLPIGAMVTLRRSKMWEFLDRFISLALPRMRDFRGVSRKAFDGHGNYTVGLKEQIIFSEIDYDRIDVIKGLNVSIVTTARTDDEGRALLQHMGMPFRAS
jgi:large subunit ribosomal protein L5